MHACEHRNVPRVLTPSIRSKRFIGVASVPVRLIALALLTRMSMPPKRCDRLRRPRRALRPRRGCRTRSAAPCRRRARSPRRPCRSCRAAWDCGSSVFAAIATFAPSRAARSAIARPMPREPPVMNRVLPASMSRRDAWLLAAERAPGRFSRNAAMPSAKSARARARAEARGFGVELLGQRARERLAHEALGVADREPRARRPATARSPRPRRRARRAGTTRFTSPQRAPAARRSARPAA